MTWKPSDTYEEQWIANKPYTGKIVGIDKQPGYFEIKIAAESGSIHKERRYLTTGALPWTQRFFSGLYYATHSEGLTVDRFEDAAAHMANLKDKPFRFALKNKKDADGEVSIYFEISMVAKLEDELSYGPRGGLKGGKRPSDADGPNVVKEETDDIPF